MRFHFLSYQSNTSSICQTQLIRYTILFPVNSQSTLTESYIYPKTMTNILKSSNICQIFLQRNQISCLENTKVKLQPKLKAFLGKVEHIFNILHLTIAM